VRKPIIILILFVVGTGMFIPACEKKDSNLLSPISEYLTPAVPSTSTPTLTPTRTPQLLIVINDSYMEFGSVLSYGNGPATEIHSDFSDINLGGSVYFYDESATVFSDESITDGDNVITPTLTPTGL